MKGRKKIIFFANTLWFLEKFKYELIKEISKNNLVTCVYLREGVIHKKDKIKELIDFHQVSFFSLKDFLKRYYSKKLLSPLKLKVFSFQKIIIFNIGPIILSSFLSKSNKGKIVYVLEGMGRVFSSKETKNLLTKSLVIIFYRFLFKKCKLICVLNSFDALFLVENNICDINKIIILPGTGINIKNIEEEIKTKERNPKYIDYIGRVLIDKGFYKFLFTRNDFAKYYPEFNNKYIFRVICPDEDIKKLSKNNLDFLKRKKIEIKPYLTSPFSYYKDSKALIVPSLYGEGLSRVVLEACYLGIPILASRSRGIQEIFPHDYKYFIKSYSPFSISQQLAEMLDDQKYFDQIGQSLKMNIKNNFSVEKAIKEFNSNIF